MTDFAFDPRNGDFPAAASRLSTALQALGFAEVPHKILLDALVFWFGGSPWLYFRAAREEGPIPQWHLIRLGDKSESMLRRQDQLTMQASRVLALAALLDEMDTTRVFAEVVRVSDRLIEFLTPEGDLIASIEPIEVQPPDLKARHRVDELLKGLRSNEVGRMAHRLQGLPGISFPQTGKPLDGSDDGLQGEVLNLSPDNLSAVLRSMLKAECQIEVKQHQAQELLAVMAGMPSWQHLNTQRDRAWLRLLPTAVVHHDPQEGPAARARVELHYAPSDALAAFAQALRASSRPAHLEVWVSELSGGGYYPVLDAADRAKTKPLDYIPPWISCCRLPLLYTEDRYEQLAADYLCDPASAQSKLREHFASDESTLARHRHGNRRAGVKVTDEIWLDPWLLYRTQVGGQDAIALEHFRDGQCVERHWAKVHKSQFYFDTKTGEIHLITEYGVKDLGVLDGLGKVHLALLGQLLRVTGLPPDLE